MDAPFAKVIRASAASLSGQMLDDARTRTESTVFIGNLVAIDSRQDRSIGVIRTTYLQPGGQSAGANTVEFDIELLGKLARDDSGGWRFTRGIPRPPAVGSGISELDEAALDAILPHKSSSRIGIGSVSLSRGREFAIDPDELLRTHFAIFGATGSGKTSAVIAVLRGLVEALPHTHAVIIDPHGEYRGSLGAGARVFDWMTLRLPYWLLRFRELAVVFKFSPESHYPSETKVLREAVMDAKRKYLKETGQKADVRLNLDSPLPYRLSDLRAAVTDRMSQLKRTEPVPAYERVLNRLDQLTLDDRFAFMFSTGYVRDMLSEVISQFLPTTANEAAISILDFSEIPDEVLDVIVACVARLLLSLANWASPDGGIPSLLVCEESSRYMATSHESGGSLAVEALGQIAREGRKYGVALGILSQRPSQLSAEIVSQCGTVFVLRTSNQHDLDFIARALPESTSALVESVPALATGEAIAFGQAVPFPINFHVSQLPLDVAPRPKTMDFTSAWTKAGPEPELLDRAIARWREHGHLFHR